MDGLFRGCQPGILRRQVVRALRFCDLPAEAERDVARALERVPPESQELLIRAAAEADLLQVLAIERLCCLTVCAASVNLADDLADGDCHYLEPRTAPGVSFLLQSLAAALAARGGVSAAGLDRFWVLLAKAAGGQSLEVRTVTWGEARYREVAGLIAGEQYAAYLRLLWDGTALEPSALELGSAVGTLALVYSDLDSGDRRFFELGPAEQAAVLDSCLALSSKLESGPSKALQSFAKHVQPAFVTQRASVS